MHLGHEGRANLRRVDVGITFVRAARAQSARVQARDSLHTLRLSTPICGAREHANYMAPTRRRHDLSNIDEVPAMSIVAGARTYGVSMPVRMSGLVRDVTTEWRSVEDDEHVGVWTAVPMIDRNSLRHSNGPKTVSDV